MARQTVGRNHGVATVARKRRFRRVRFRRSRVRCGDGRKRFRNHMCVCEPYHVCHHTPFNHSDQSAQTTNDSPRLGHLILAESAASSEKLVQKNLKLKS